MMIVFADRHLANLRNNGDAKSDIGNMKKPQDLHGAPAKRDEHELMNNENKESGSTLHFENHKDDLNPRVHIKADMISHQMHVNKHKGRKSEDEEEKETPTYSGEAQNGEEIHVLHQVIEINHEDHMNGKKDNKRHETNKSRDQHQQHELTKHNKDRKERHKVPKRKMNMAHHKMDSVRPEASFKHATKSRPQSPKHTVYGRGRYLFQHGHGHLREHFHRDKIHHMIRRPQHPHHGNQDNHYHDSNKNQRYYAHHGNRDNNHYDYNDRFQNDHYDSGHYRDSDDHMDNEFHGHENISPRNRQIHPSWHHTEHQGSRSHHHHRSQRDISSQDDFYMSASYNLRPFHPIVLMKDFEVEDDDNIGISKVRTRRTNNCKSIYKLKRYC